MVNDLSIVSQNSINNLFKTYWICIDSTNFFFL